jgi:hypothetical protein
MPNATRTLALSLAITGAPAGACSGDTQPSEAPSKTPTEAASFVGAGTAATAEPDGTSTAVPAAYDSSEQMFELFEERGQDPTRMIDALAAIRENGDARWYRSSSRSLASSETGRSRTQWR